MFGKKVTRTIWIGLALLSLSLTVPGLAGAGSKEGFPSGVKVNYFLNAQASVGTTDVIRIYNPSVDHSVCEQIYVFATDQQMLECCSCPLSPSGSSGVAISGLLMNSPRGPATNIGTVKIVSTVPTPTCGVSQEKDADAEIIQGGLRAWIIHGLNATNAAIQTEIEFADTGEPATDEELLASMCATVQTSGSGVCALPLFCPGLKEE